MSWVLRASCVADGYLHLELALQVVVASSGSTELAEATVQQAGIEAFPLSELVLT